MANANVGHFTSCDKVIGEQFLRARRRLRVMRLKLRFTIAEMGGSDPRSEGEQRLVKGSIL